MIIWVSESATWASEIGVSHGIRHLVCCNVPCYLQMRWKQGMNTVQTVEAGMPFMYAGLMERLAIGWKAVRHHPTLKPHIKQAKWILDLHNKSKKHGSFILNILEFRATISINVSIYCLSEAVHLWIMNKLKIAYRANNPTRLRSFQWWTQMEAATIFFFQVHEV